MIPNSVLMIIIVSGLSLRFTLGISSEFHYTLQSNSHFVDRATATALILVTKSERNRADSISDISSTIIGGFRGGHGSRPPPQTVLCVLWKLRAPTTFDQFVSHWRWFFVRVSSLPRARFQNLATACAPLRKNPGSGPVHVNRQCPRAGVGGKLLISA